MRIAPSLSVVCAVILSACSGGMDTDSSAARLVAPASARLDQAEGETRGAVFTATNGANANAVVAFARAEDGSLTFAGTFNTGGKGIGGTADPLASQYSLLLDGEDDRLLFVVNAGSNNVSAFRVSGASLTLVGTTSSGGSLPTSLAIANHTLYVLNAGSNSVRGFDIGATGDLTPNASASAALSTGASGAAAIRASRDGRFLVVTEKGSRTIDVFAIGDHGRLGPA